MFRIDTVLKAVVDQSWLICRVVFAGYLGVLTVMDIRNKRLNLLFLLSGFLLMAAGFFCKREIHPLLLATGAGVGLVFLLASRVTGESFGYGDSLLILIMGAFLGFWDVLSVLTAAFLLAAVFSVIMLIRKRFSRKTAFPFVPFLMIAYTGGMILGMY